MKRSLDLVVVAVIFFVSGVAGQASAQWPRQNQGTPRDGACFYLDGGYNNQSFCLNAGQSMNRLPSGFNDQITSIRVFGGATVTVFEDADLRGPSETFDRSQNDLRSVRKRDDSSRVWSDRISSVRVDFTQVGDRADQADHRWDGHRPTWGRGPHPHQGACFFRDTGFQGDYFCIAGGESFRALPSGFNDRISSIRVFGGTRVIVFQENDFRGANETFDRSQNDLGSVRKRDDMSRSWSDRISSVRVDFAQGGDRADQGDNRGDGRGPVWGRGPQPRQGACFFRDTNFQGDSFCMARGESFRALPAGFNDRISSIRVFGGTRVIVFQDNDFRGTSETFDRSQNDLRSVRKRDDRSRVWTDRISSVRVD